MCFDFEEAQSTAFETVFNVPRQGCFFHFCQAILRKIRNHFQPLACWLNTGKVFKRKITLNKFVDLAFLKKENTGDDFDALVASPEATEVPEISKFC